MVPQDQSSFHDSKQPATGKTTCDSVVDGDCGGGDNEVEGFDSSSQSLAGKSEIPDDQEQSISPVNESVVADDSVSPGSGIASTEGIRDSEENKKGIVGDEAEKEIEEDCVDKFENVEEKLVSSHGIEDGIKEEKSLVSGKVDDDDDDDKSGKVVEEEIVMVVESSSAKESVDVVDKTTLTIEEPDDLTVPCDGDIDLAGKETSEAPKLHLLEKEESRLSENNGEEGGNKISVAEIDQGSVAGFRMCVTDEEAEEKMVFDRIDGQIVTDSDEEDEVKTIDNEALAKFINAVTSGYSGGGKLFSMESTPAGLGSFSRRVQFPAPRTNRFNGIKFKEESESELSEEDKQKLEKLQTVRVKYLRLLHRLGQSIEDTLAGQVLNRLALLARNHSGVSFSLDSAKKIAMESEAEGKELDFSLNILVLGKSGVGKSATINSIFNDEKPTATNAFRDSTTSVREISGTVNGIKIRIIDTPGLKTSAMDQTANSKILSSVKKVMKKCPPDIVLYVDRLDAQKKGSLNDLPLLKTITASLGSSIWTNAIVTLTHSGSAAPDDLNHEEFLMQCSNIVQHSIGQALGLIYSIPWTQVAFVENHRKCRQNRHREKVLPNGIPWRSELLLFCFSRKIVSDAISLLKPQEPLPQKPRFFGSRIRVQSLLAWLLQSHPHPKLPGDQSIDSDIKIGDISDSDEENEDEYNQLPPFKPLRKTQLAKLSKEQKKAYFDEYDYRVKLFKKKQLKEELKRMKKNKNVHQEEEEEEEAATVASPLPDIVLPLTFDSDDSTYRYRSLEPSSTSKLHTRTELEPQGWDHDYGYNSVIADRSLTIAKRFPALVTLHVTKDKKDSSIYLDSSVSNGSTMGKFVIQGSEEQLIYMLKGETKLKKTILGGLVTLIGKIIATGIKLEKEIALTKRLVLFANAGTTRSKEDSVYEGNLEVKLRDADLLETQGVLGMSLTKSKHDFAVTGNLRYQVCIGRGTKVAGFVSVDNKMRRRITVRTSSLDHLQIALVAFLPIVKSLYKKVLGSRED